MVCGVRVTHSIKLLFLLLLTAPVIREKVGNASSFAGLKFKGNKLKNSLKCMSWQIVFDF